MLKKHLCLVTAVLMMTAMSIRSAESGKPSKEEETSPVAAQTLDAQLDELARQVLESLRVERKSKIAVPAFTDLNGGVTEFGQFVAEELITRLYRSGSFQVVERSLLTKVITEQEMSLSGLVDTNSAQTLGKILGVDAIATGSITDLGDVLKLNARLISTETGMIFAVASVEVWKDRGVSQLLEKRMHDDVTRAPAKPKLNQGDAANAATLNNPLGVSGSTVGNYELGRRAIERMAVALGGASRFATLDGYYEEVVYDAIIKDNHLKFEIMRTVSYPKNIHTVTKIPFGDIIRVVTGTQGWTISPLGTQDLEASELEEDHRNLRTAMIGILRNPGVFTFQALEERTIEGIICLPVYVTCADEDCGLFYLDQQTDLPMMIQRTCKSPITGEPATEKRYIDKYTAFRGILLPSTVRLMYNDEEFATFHVSAFTSNPKIDPTLFVRK